MRHGHHGRAGVEQFGQEGGELRPGVGVLAERRLVEDQDLRVGRQHGGHREPPLFPARERVRVGVHEVRQPQPFQQFVHPLFAVAQVPRAKLQLVEDPAGDELVLRFLEDRADPGDQLFGPPPVGIDSGSAAQLHGGGHLAVDRREQAGERQRERGFARTVGPRDGQRFAGADLRRDVPLHGLRRDGREAASPRTLPGNTTPSAARSSWPGATSGWILAPARPPGDRCRVGGT